MTQKDLHLQYNQETGKEIPDLRLFDNVYIPRDFQDDLLEYLKWLESKLTTNN